MTTPTERTALREEARVKRERKEERRRYLTLRVKSLHAEGLNMRVIATRLHVGGHAVSDVLQALGLIPHRKQEGP
jgi:hypothetical protein